MRLDTIPHYTIRGIQQQPVIIESRRQPMRIPIERPMGLPMGLPVGRPRGRPMRIPIGRPMEIRTSQGAYLHLSHWLRRHKAQKTPPFNRHRVPKKHNSQTTMQMAIHNFHNDRKVVPSQLLAPSLPTLQYSKHFIHVADLHPRHVNKRQSLLFSLKTHTRISFRRRATPYSLTNTHSLGLNRNPS